MVDQHIQVFITFVPFMPMSVIVAEHGLKRIGVMMLMIGIWTWGAKDVWMLRMMGITVMMVVRRR
jgi:hypothetical protein